jgi:hypothetical protein
MVRSHPRQIVLENLSQKPLHKNRAGGMAESEGPEFKLQKLKKKKKKKKVLDHSLFSENGNLNGLHHLLHVLGRAILLQ